MSADLRIDQELAICEAATQWGVLRMHTYEDGTSSNRIFEHLTGRLIADNVDGPDATFIAHARTGYPLALRRIQELEKQLAAALAERDELRRVLNTCDDVIKQASHEMYWLDQQRKFTKGGSCDKARIGLKWAKMAIDNLKPQLTPDTEAT